MSVLYYGDNLHILRQHIDDESVDLIYLDPPFKSGQEYNILFKERNGSHSSAQIKAFEDTWEWDMLSAKTYEEVVMQGGELSQVIQAFRDFLGESDMMAYLAMMAPRLVELKRVLKSTGSIYLHCDTTAKHYLKILLDAIFGPTNFRNEIIWRRTAFNKSDIRYGPIHQCILFYTKSDDYYFNPQYGPYTKEYVEKYFKLKDEGGYFQSVSLTGPGTVEDGDSGKEWKGCDPTKIGRHWAIPSYLEEKYLQITGDDLSKHPLLEQLDMLDEVGLIYWGKKAKTPRYKQYIDDMSGVPLTDIWAYQPGTEGCVHGNPEISIDEDVKWLTSYDSERLGYPTQKPEGILDRIIRSSSKEGDVVLDPFCGCGTTISVAQKLKRIWIGIDITYLAISLIKNRLKDTFGDEVSFEVIGEPVSLSGAKALAEQDPFQFEWWALGLVGARPAKGKKGADKGIDGRIYFFDEIGKRRQAKNIVISVKSGNVGVSHIRDLRGVMEREESVIGVLITLNEPTKPMRDEATKAGFYTSPELVDNRYPRIQILTIEELLDGQGILFPSYGRQHGNVTFKKARSYQERLDS